MHVQSQTTMNTQHTNTNKSKNITIGSWNLCLGLRNKKDYVSKMIKENKIDIICSQENDIKPDYPLNILSFRGYDYLSENNSTKARTGMYINNLIPYQRRTDLEKVDCGVIIIDIKLSKNYRIIGLYRTFTPNNGTSEYNYFKNQMDIITNSSTEPSTNLIVIGDFNLDDNQKNNSQYSHCRYNDLLQSTFNDINLLYKS